MEQELSKDSDIKPSDLVNCIFVDGKNGVNEVIQDEVGGYFLKLSTINRLRAAFAESSNLVSIVSSPVVCDSSKAKEVVLKKADWRTMVKMNKEVANKQPEQGLEDEFKEGCNYTFTESKTPHGEWFANDPKGACDLIEGVTFFHDILGLDFLDDASYAAENSKYHSFEGMWDATRDRTGGAPIMLDVLHWKSATEAEKLSASQLNFNSG